MRQMNEHHNAKINHQCERQKDIGKTCLSWLVRSFISFELQSVMKNITMNRSISSITRVSSLPLPPNIIDPIPKFFTTRAFQANLSLNKILQHKHVYSCHKQYHAVFHIIAKYSSCSLVSIDKTKTLKFSTFDR